jgi:hypothetical protein
MAGGPILPSSIYVGGASGSLSPTFYVPGTNTNSAGAIEGIGVVSSLALTVSAVLQFNLPESIPTGVFKCRTLGWANATAGNAVITLNDGQTAVGANIGATTLSPETQFTFTWAAAQNDIIKENKTNLTTVPTANNILTIRVDYVGAGAVWTLAQLSVFQHSLVWE